MIPTVAYGIGTSSSGVPDGACTTDADLDVVAKSVANTAGSGVPDAEAAGGGLGGKAEDAADGGEVSAFNLILLPEELAASDGPAAASACSCDQDACGGGIGKAAGAGAYPVFRYGGGDFDGGVRSNSTVAE